MRWKTLIACFILYIKTFIEKNKNLVILFNFCLKREVQWIYILFCSHLLLLLLSWECIEAEQIAELGIECKLLVVELDGLGGMGGRSSSIEFLSGEGGFFNPLMWWLWWTWCKCNRAWSGWRKLGRRDCCGVFAGLTHAMPQGDGEAFKKTIFYKLASTSSFIFYCFILMDCLFSTRLI